MANECLYRVMAQNIPHGAILLFDHDMRYELAGGSAIQELTGHDSSFYVGKLAQEVTSFADRALIEYSYRAALKGETRDQTVRVGAQLVALHTAPIRGENGAIERGMAFLSNITARKRLEGTLLAQAEQLALLSRVGNEVNKANTVREALARLLQILGARWNYYATGHAFFLRKDDELATADLWWTSDETRFEPFKQAIERTDLPGRVLQTRKPSWSADLQKHPSSLIRAAAEACGLRSALSFPVLVGDDEVPAAVIQFFSTHPCPTTTDLPQQQHYYPPIAAAVMQTIGPQLTHVAQRERHAARIHTLSTTDDLTQLHNRRGFVALAQQQLKTAERNRKPLLVLFADLDGLKAVNDTHGHAAGDGLIAEAGRVLRDAFRESDVVARLGGDEFAVLMPDTDIDGSGALLRRLRARVEEANDNNNRSGGYRLELSLGLTSFDPARPETLGGLLDRADALMYEHKQARKRGQLDGGSR